jgi:hypothetical protein
LGSTWKDYMVLPEVKVKKDKDKVRNITRRRQGTNLQEMMKKLNEVVRGFGNYYGIGKVKGKFQRLDEWTRMRVHAFMRNEEVNSFEFADSKSSIGKSGHGISNDSAHHTFLIQA